MRLQCSKKHSGSEMSQPRLWNKAGRDNNLLPVTGRMSDLLPQLSLGLHIKVRESQGSACHVNSGEGKV